MKILLFSPEVTFKVEKYNNSKENYLIESSAGPYVLFTKNINDDFRIYGKVGVPVFRKDESKAEGYRYSKSQHQHMVKLDLNIFLGGINEKYLILCCYFIFSSFIFSQEIYRDRMRDFYTRIKRKYKQR